MKKGVTKNTLVGELTVLRRQGIFRAAPTNPGNEVITIRMPAMIKKNGIE